MVTNNTGIRYTVQRMRENFRKLYKSRAHVHHFLQYCEEEDFTTALGETGEVVRDYYHAHLRAYEKIRMSLENGESQLNVPKKFTLNPTY